MTNTLNYLKKHPETVWLLAILALSTLLRLAFLHEPFDRDEGQYATIAQEILRGGLPYRDAIEIKPPGTFYLYALAIGLFGATTESVRMFTAFYAMLTVLAVYEVARHIAGIRAGLCAALVYGIFSTFPLLEGSSSNTEVFLVLPMTAGIWFLLKALETRKRSYLYGAGMCAGLAVLIKPVALPAVALELLLIPFFRTGTGRIKESALDLAAFLLPMAACAFATLSYFSLRGGLNDLLYWTVEFPRLYKASIIEGPPLRLALVIVASSLEFPALLGIPTALWLTVTKRTITGTLPLLMILAICLSIALPGKYFQHYFITIIPFLAIPAGIGLARIPEMRRVPACLTLFVLCAALWFAVMTNFRYYTVYSPETVSNYKHGEPTFAESVDVARYLREHTQPDDYIFQWGFEPELYFLADRRCPNPYLVSVLPGWSKDPQQTVNKMMQSLIGKKPVYIVFQPGWSDFEGKREITEYILKNCREESRLGYAYINRCSTK